MKKHIQPLPDHRTSGMASYVTGLLFSLALSGGAFALVWAYTASDGAIMSRTLLIVLLSLFAAAQVLVQVTYFLHMSAERRARITLVSSVFTLIILAIVMFGSIWIMHNLDYNMMPQHIEEYIQEEENIYRTSE